MKLGIMQPYFFPYIGYWQLVKAVNLEGQQEILAIEPMENESEETYSALFRKLQDRGLEKVWLCVSTHTRGCRAQ